MKDKIALGEWFEEKKEKIRAFELYWNSLRNEDAESFPESLPKGDWDEQFNFFSEEV